jgi:hypothetical protein
MRNETVVGEAFRRAGVHAPEARFRVALAEYLNNGGTVARARELVDAAAERMGSEGQTIGAAKADLRAPSSPRANDDAKGQSTAADDAAEPMPAASSPERNGAGQQKVADKAGFDVPRPVSALYVAAAKIGAKQLATTVLDSFKVRDGRPIGDVRIGELETMRTANVREAAVLRQIQRLGYADANMTVRALVDHDTLAKMIQKAAEIADAS